VPFMRLCGIIRYNWTDHIWQYVWHKHLACWINTNQHAEYYLLILLFYSKCGHTKTPQCYIICTLPVLLHTQMAVQTPDLSHLFPALENRVLHKKMKLSTTQDNDLFSWLAPVSAHVSHLCQWLRVWVQENSCDTMMHCSTRHPLSLT
jgi:hypothetical protein